ncbi:hypothetical protein PPYR_05510 [Photinus pyralis]|uniref:WAP domain-containing protein n=1 Tax=Photinus pyralis TaxID=7054 RepID=A0A5N4AV05_PHOPY|nr:integumentary mucin C.1-like [Photinus pyralis]KAB0801156.1 hypothetical protein PPYR_05510 [Photinus pyralis]
MKCLIVLLFVLCKLVWILGDDDNSTSDNSPNSSTSSSTENAPTPSNDPTTTTTPRTSTSGSTENTPTPSNGPTTTTTPRTSTSSTSKAATSTEKPDNSCYFLGRFTIPILSCKHDCSLIRLPLIGTCKTKGLNCCIY